MKKSDRQNALAVAAVALCFMLTLGLCYFLGGEGFLIAFNQSEGEVKCYLLCGGSYENVTLARNAAELAKSRGGAGYVIVGDVSEVVLAAYASYDDAQSVLDGGSAGTGAYIKEVTVGEIPVDWAPKDMREAAESALGYYDIVFDCLYETANGIAADSLTVADARTRVAVCRARVEEMRSDFSDASAGSDDARCTELKLALVTALALIDNVALSDMYGSAAAVSSLRYQCVQLVLCREALYGVLAG